MELIPETTKDFGYLKILDLYSEEELKNISKEISYLDYAMNKMKLGSLQEDKDMMHDLRGKNQNGISKMSGEGLSIDSIYLDREYSAILTYNRKLFRDNNIVDSMAATHPANSLYSSANRDMTLLNRYSNSQEYASHSDIAAFTAVTVILKKPENIKGGDLIFPDYNITFECENNSCIIFPSWVRHCVTSLESCCGAKRYSIAQLMYVTPKSGY